METKSRMGRPKGPDKVYYRRYVTNEEAAALDKARASGLLMKADWVQTAPSEANLKALEPHAEKVIGSAMPELKAALDSVNRLEDERAELKKMILALTKGGDGKLEAENKLLKAKVKEYEQMYG